MDNPRDIRRRIKSISSTAQITRAMQMVAASKMKKIQDAALRGRPFVRQLYRFQLAATTRLRKFSHPLLEVREVRKRAVILIGPDKGLCGPLNANLFRLAAQFDPDTTLYITAGRKVSQFIARSRRKLVAEFAYSEMPRFAEARAIAAFACDLFQKKEVDAVLVCSTRFINTLTQDPITLEYLPVGEIKSLKLLNVEPKQDLLDDEDILFEPDRNDVLNFLLTHYVNIYIYQFLLNSRASEQSARMVSMKNATDSAESLIKELSLEYNKIRQGNITQEMLEIAGGAAG
jgi:F-type H+-transporting ATPase subunit gamma